LPGRRIAGAGGVLGGPILSAYPGWMRHASAGADCRDFGRELAACWCAYRQLLIGFIYTFGTALFPELAYVILFLPMIFVIAFRPQAVRAVGA